MPTADRLDIAYLDVWEREVRSAEDATLINPAIGVVLRLENNQIFVQPFGLPQTPGLPQALLEAMVDPDAGRFRIGIRPQGTAATTIRVRWWAFRTSQDRGTLVVPQGISVTLEPRTITLR
jgi:hypothetical protein